MRIVRHNILAISIAVCSLSAAAQDLHTEITVDRTVQPDVRPATRLSGFTPAIFTPDIKLKDLTAAEYTDPGDITNQISVLPAASWPDSISHARYRGYASVGYMPLYNLGLNAGYRIVDTPRFGLGMWAQYNGNSYNGDIPYFDDALFKNHHATIGGNGSLRFNPNTLLTLSGHASLMQVRHPYYYVDEQAEHRRSYTQNARDINGQFKFMSRAGNMMYDVGGSLSYFDLPHDIPKEISTFNESVRQAWGSLDLNLGLAEEDTSIPWIGIGGGLEIMRVSNLPYIVNGYYTKYRVNNVKLAHINPFIRFDNDVLHARVGANITFGSESNISFKVAPEAQIDWLPVKPVAMYAKVSGGQYFNYMSHLFAINPYVDPTRAYETSNMPLLAEGGINLGPYDGMALGIRGGYAMARNYLSPLITIYKDGFMNSTFEYRNVNSWYIGANVSYAYQDLFSIAFDIAYGGSDYETHSWCQWIDAPKVVSDVTMKITPIAPLDLTINYNMRYDRKARSVIFPYNITTEILYVGQPNLGTINDINLRGQYRFNPQLSAFLSAENLLNNRYKLISGIESQGIHGLLGISCLF